MFTLMKVFNFDEMPIDIQKDVIKKLIYTNVRFSFYTSYTVSIKISPQYNLLPNFLIKNGAHEGENVIIQGIKR